MHQPRAAGSINFSRLHSRFPLQNKSTLNVFPFPWLLATIQLGETGYQMRARHPSRGLSDRAITALAALADHTSSPLDVLALTTPIPPPYAHSPACGVLWMVGMWVTKLHPVPTVPGPFWAALAPVALFHTVGHVSACVSFAAVAVSFTHVIKSAEPVFRSAVCCAGRVSEWAASWLALQPSGSALWPCG